MNAHSALLQAFDRDGALGDEPVLAVADREQHPGAGRQQPDPLRRVVAKDRLQPDFFAEPVDAAIREDRAAEHRLRLIEIEGEAERPRHDAFVPVAADVSDVAVLLRRDDEREPPPALRSRAGPVFSARAPGRRRRSCRLQTVSFWRFTIATFAVGTGAPVSSRVTKHQRVLRTVLDRQPEVR